MIGGNEESGKIYRDLINTLRPGQNGRHFADDIFKCIFLNENVWIPIKISLKFVPKGQINKIPALVQIMAWRRPGDKPLSEPMMVSFLTHICVTRPQWVNTLRQGQFDCLLESILKLVFVFEYHYIMIEISPKLVPKVPIINAIIGSDNILPPKQATSHYAPLSNDELTKNYQTL